MQSLKSIYQLAPGTVLPVFLIQIFRSARIEPAFMAAKVIGLGVERDAIERIHRRMQRNHIHHIQVYRFMVTK
jgi:hypothetical protein